MPLSPQCLGNLNRARLSRCQHNSKLQARQASLLTSSRASGLSEGSHVRRLSHRNHPIASQLPSPKRVLRASSSAAAASAGVHNTPSQSFSRQALPTTILTEHSEEDLDWTDLPTQQRKLRQRAARDDVRLELADQSQSDISFWAHHLARSQRKDGEDGVLQIWRVVDKRRALTQVDGPEAHFFWVTILNAALTDDYYIEDIHAYADWLLQTHDARWPDLYLRIVSHCLRNSQYRRAFRWHLKLIATFDPGAEAFGRLLVEHIYNTNRTLQVTLQSLYMTSRHRSMYNVLIPGLYERGLSIQCTEWRDFLLRFYDVPQPNPAAQPYIRFLAGYYPNKDLVLEEQVVAGLTPTATPQHLKHHALLEGPHLVGDTEHEYYHGHGKARRFSDSWGARWFASSWIPLDFAIHALQGLNVHAIGPLSLQSLALREPTASAIRSRLNQLRKLNISIGQSNYAKAIHHFAESDNDELLKVLLRSDIHPDVFDDFDTQKQILDLAAANGDVHISRLLLTIQTAVARDSVHETSNQLLRNHLVDGEMDRAVGLMDDMKAMDIEMGPSTTELIHRQLLEIVPWDIPFSAANGRRLSEVIALASRLSATRKLVPAKAWQNILFNSAKYGRLGTMEQLAIQLVDGFQKRIGEDGGLMSVHESDFPSRANIDIGGDGFTSPLQVPMDLPITHDWHPIRRVFVSRDLQAAIVRFGFNKGLIRARTQIQAQIKGRDGDRRNGDVGIALVHPGQDMPGGSAAAVSTRTRNTRLAEFYMARGVRLLKELQDRGIPIDKRLVREELVSCLVASGLADANEAAADATRFSCQPQNKTLQVPEVKGDNLGLALSDVVRLVNLAFEEELLPGPFELRDRISLEMARREVEEMSRTRLGGKSKAAGARKRKF